MLLCDFKIKCTKTLCTTKVFHQMPIDDSANPYLTTNPNLRFAIISGTKGFDKNVL